MPVGEGKKNLGKCCSWVDSWATAAAESRQGLARRRRGKRRSQLRARQNICPSGCNLHRWIRSPSTKSRARKVKVSWSPSSPYSTSSWQTRGWATLIPSPITRSLGSWQPHSPHSVTLVAGSSQWLSKLVAPKPCHFRPHGTTLMGSLCWELFRSPSMAAGFPAQSCFCPALFRGVSPINPWHFWVHLTPISERTLPEVKTANS